LKDKGAEMLARQVDIGVIQRVSVAELFGLAEQLERAPEEALEMLRHSLAAFREEQRTAEKEMMSNDRKLVLRAAAGCALAPDIEPDISPDIDPESCPPHRRHRLHGTLPHQRVCWNKRGPRSMFSSGPPTKIRDGKG